MFGQVCERPDRHGRRCTNPGNFYDGGAVVCYWDVGEVLVPENAGVIVSQKEAKAVFNFIMRAPDVDRIVRYYDEGSR